MLKVILAEEELLSAMFVLVRANHTPVRPLFDKRTFTNNIPSHHEARIKLFS